MTRLLCVGVGHVGLPLSLKLWNAGHHVSLVDVDEPKIRGLRHGHMPFREEGCEELLQTACRDSRFLPLIYDDSQFLPTVAGAEYIVLTLGTPLGTDYTFRFDQYFDVLQRIMPAL